MLDVQLGLVLRNTDLAVNTAPAILNLSSKLEQWSMLVHFVDFAGFA
jgi:hypothetical protein